MNKSGQAIWVSFVILVAFAVALGVLIGQQMIESSQRSSEQIKEYVYDTQECSGVGINIQDICQNPQVLNMEVANIRNVKVEELFIKIFDGSGDAETKTVTLSIVPGDENTLSIGKSRIADRVEIMPVIHVEDQVIMCRERLAEQDYIQDCE